MGCSTGRGGHNKKPGKPEVKVSKTKKAATVNCPKCGKPMRAVGGRFECATCNASFSQGELDTLKKGIPPGTGQHRPDNRKKK
jgi:tRNA(Ile2) C34 agmatinyltransferase TiaS